MASKNINIGGSVSLQSVKDIAHVFGMKTQGCFLMLSHLKVPIIHVGSDAYVMLSTLEEALYTMGELGGPGFMAPASQRKHRAIPGKPNPAAELDPKLLTPAARTRRQTAMSRISKAKTASLQQQLKNFLKDKARG